MGIAIGAAAICDRLQTQPRTQVLTPLRCRNPHTASAIARLLAHLASKGTANHTYLDTHTERGRALCVLRQNPLSWETFGKCRRR